MGRAAPLGTAGVSSAIVAVGAVVAVVAAGCGPGGPPADESGRPGESAELAYAACMREHGYDWPDPTWVDDGWDTHIEEEIDYDSEAFQQDAAACEEVRHAAGSDATTDWDADETDAFLAERLEFAECMRNEGIEFPDPQVDAQGVGELAGPIDGDWDAFNAASEICEAEIRDR